jgi:hypothetical protein
MSRNAGLSWATPPTGISSDCPGRYFWRAVSSTPRRAGEHEVALLNTGGKDPRACLDRRSLPICRQDVKESKQITLGSSDSTCTTTDLKYSMSGKVISITYLGTGSIHEELGRILRMIEHWHSIKSYRILYQDASGLGGEVTWDGEKAEVVAPR